MRIYLTTILSLFCFSYNLVAQNAKHLLNETSYPAFTQVVNRIGYEVREAILDEVSYTADSSIALVLSSDNDVAFLYHTIQKRIIRRIDFYYAQTSGIISPSGTHAAFFGVEYQEDGSKKERLQLVDLNSLTHRTFGIDEYEVLNKSEFDHEEPNRIYFSKDENQILLTGFQTYDLVKSLIFDMNSLHFSVHEEVDTSKFVSTYGTVEHLLASDFFELQDKHQLYFSQFHIDANTLFISPPQVPQGELYNLATLSNTEPLDKENRFWYFDNTSPKWENFGLRYYEEYKAYGVINAYRFNDSLLAVQVFNYGVQSIESDFHIYTLSGKLLQTIWKKKRRSAFYFHGSDPNSIQLRVYDMDESGRKQLDEKILLIDRSDLSIQEIGLTGRLKKLKSEDLNRLSEIPYTFPVWECALNKQELLLRTNNLLFRYNIEKNELNQFELRFPDEIKSVLYLTESDEFIVSCINGLAYRVKSDGQDLQTLDLNGISAWSMQINQNQLFALGKANNMAILDLNTNKTQLIFNFIAMPKGKRLLTVQTTEGYYLLPKEGFENIHFSGTKNAIFYPEQLDIIFNRPDLVVEKMGRCNSSYLKLLQSATAKRNRKMGGINLDPSSAPIAHFDLIESNGMVRVSVTGKSNSANLMRIHILNNGVPVFGVSGQRIEANRSYEGEFDIPLVAGSNSIQVFVEDENGLKSQSPIRELELQNTIKNRLQFIGLGVSTFEDSKHNLKYADKDIRDALIAIRESRQFDEIIVDTLLNENCTNSNIVKLKSKLEKLSPNDYVLVYFSGHGLLNHNFDYYLSSYDVNFSEPNKGGISYQSVLDLLDSIPSYNKLILIDACHSGELDKEEVSNFSLAEFAENSKGNAFEALNIQASSFDKMRELFADVRGGNGALILSSSSGNDVSFEDPNLQNGFFTAAFIDAVKNHNLQINLSEFIKEIEDKVYTMSEGKQRPNVRQMNRFLTSKVQ